MAKFYKSITIEAATYIGGLTYSYTTMISIGIGCACKASSLLLHGNMRSNADILKHRMCAELAGTAVN